ncbi:MAG TPA: bifunctional UDP-sugar hydrolase/5'-nucleotidase [Anaerolineae bacterium]|nr:bifunctional UDP-sugar hydrolase/5'-nucleotidase [Anaerolineae bacterium]
MLTLLFCLLLAAVPGVTAQEATVTILHVSDYHSHAEPFYSEGRAGVGGIARAIAYLRPFANDPGAVILSGGDLINRGTPAWSDKYTCAEWPWFNGIVDAMAFGNHDADYGPDVFARCRAELDYPILSANTLDAAGNPLFAVDGKPYLVVEAGGVKIGLLSLAGSDFESLIKPEFRPSEGATFGDRVATARSAVQALRETEGVAAVVLFGHAHYDDDVALAQAVPGIDLILGTHSHLKKELAQLPGTQTYYVSSYQYLTYIGRVELAFVDGKLQSVSGGPVAMSPDLPQDAEIVERVAAMQADLEADPQYAPLFEPIGQAQVELSIDGSLSGESVLGNLVMDVVRAAAGTHAAMSTASSFRQPIPPGEIVEEMLRTTMPYTNKLFAYELTGAQVQALLDHSVSRKGSDFFSQVSGVRFAIDGARAVDVEILRDPADPGAGYAPLDPAATYQLAITDFQAKVAAGYKEILAGLPARETGLEVREQVRAHLGAHSPIHASLDGRIRSAQPGLPESGGPGLDPLSLSLLGLLVAASGLVLHRRARQP